MGPDTVRLVELLDEAAALLRSCGDAHWASWLEKDGKYLRAGDFRGIEHFLGAFGGMGSINDLILHPVNGHSVSLDKVDSVNTKLQSLLSKAAEVAEKMHRDAFK